MYNFRFLVSLMTGWLILQMPNGHIWIYVVLGAIIFIETGLVIFPFFPGDSILFFVGSLAAMSNGKLSIGLLILVMGIIASLLIC